ncbi:MAG: carboxylating nicotinate-nucleotide diphosphorylase [Spirochaetota bacterium]|nr:carboxylating nicotinate-nucleotide diphosphorylase [Spirochaetota bacterium]
MNIDQLYKEIKPLIILALKEDIGNGDITSCAIFQRRDISTAIIYAKEDSIFCGGEVVNCVYNEIDPNLKISIQIKDGSLISKDEMAIEIDGNTKSILMGERLALNFIGRMSGIATKVHRVCKTLEGTDVKLFDTRKTLPGFRLLDKYSVKMGGGHNHRLGLYDMVMIKDNHIKAAGSIQEAVNRVRAAHGNKYKIEVESKTLMEVEEAVESGVDVIMLDNMNPELMQRSIELIDGRSKIEISGNIDEVKIRKIRNLKIDYISMGALTHSVRSMDYSMKFL